MEQKELEEGNVYYYSAVKKLTGKETLVFDLMVAGHKNNAIAEILNLNNKTIGTYKERLKSKFNLTSKDNDYKTVTTILRESKYYKAKSIIKESKK